MRSENGFTLVELLVVILIMGILMAFAVPQYSRTIENSAAQDAQVTLQAIASGVRMAKMDRVYVKNNSELSPTLDSTTGGTGATVTQGYSAGQLITKGYLSNLSYGKKYKFFVCSPDIATAAGCCSGSAACAKRIEGEYVSWTYKVDGSGQCTNEGTDVPDCQ